MRLLILPLVLVMPAAGLALSAPQAVYPPRVIGPPARLDCPSAWDVYRAKLPKEVRAQPLGELPPGQLALAVERHVGGCPEPAILRTGIGGGADGLGRPHPGGSSERRR